MNVFMMLELGLQISFHCAHHVNIIEDNLAFHNVQRLAFETQSGDSVTFFSIRKFVLLA